MGTHLKMACNGPDPQFEQHCSSHNTSKNKKVEHSNENQMCQSWGGFMHFGVLFGTRQDNSSSYIFHLKFQFAMEKKLLFKSFRLWLLNTLLYFDRQELD